MDDDKTVALEHLPTVPNYQVCGHLGEGGMAHVYLADDLQLKRQVALKVISQALSNMNEFRERFANEGRIVARFRHPNIVAVHASGETGGQRYIIMEFVPGGTLSERLERGRLSETEAVWVAMRMTEALAYSHDHGVIHRDFKPSNILFTDEGEPVLSDFGVAKSLGEDARTVVGMVVGAPRYMAPEQAAGQDATDRVDVFAWGLVFFEMLTGSLPARDKRIVRNDADAAYLTNSLTSHQRRYAKLICRCLQADPADRPSAAECAQVLGRILKGGGMSRTVKLGGIAAGVVVLVGVIVIAASKLMDSRVEAIETTGGPVAATIVAPNPPAPGESEAPLLQLDHLPSGVRVYLNGRVTQARAIDLDESSGYLMSVCDGFVGQLIELEDAAPGFLDLAPLGLPSAAEHNRFVQAFFGSSSSAGEADVNHSALEYALALKRSDVASRRELAARLELLGHVGDQSASLALYLGAELNLIVDTGEQWIAALDAASEGGYALASFYLALHVKDRAGLRMTEGSATFERYMTLLDLAQAQGLALGIIEPIRSNVIQD